MEIHIIATRMKEDTNGEYHTDLVCKQRAAGVRGWKECNFGEREKKTKEGTWPSEEWK